MLLYVQTIYSFSSSPPSAKPFSLLNLMLKKNERKQNGTANQFIIKEQSFFFPGPYLKMNK